jgi:hypothetical protein
VHTSTRIVVDHTEDGTFQINFKISLPELSCEARHAAALPRRARVAQHAS